MGSNKNLSYDIPLDLAQNKRKILIKYLSQSGINPADEKIQTLTLHRIGQTKTQLGAIQWGGDTKKINETNCIAYIELRFYRQSLAPITEKRLSSIQEFRNDSNEALRFQFWFQDLNKLEFTFNKIAEALK